MCVHDPSRSCLNIVSTFPAGTQPCSVSDKRTALCSACTVSHKKVCAWCFVSFCRAASCCATEGQDHTSPSENGVEITNVDISYTCIVKDTCIAHYSTTVTTIENVCCAYHPDGYRQPTPASREHTQVTAIASSSPPSTSTSTNPTDHPHTPTSSPPTATTAPTELAQVPTAHG